MRCLAYCNSSMYNILNILLMTEFHKNKFHGQLYTDPTKIIHNSTRTTSQRLIQYFCISINLVLQSIDNLSITKGVNFTKYAMYSNSVNVLCQNLNFSIHASTLTKQTNRVTNQARNAGPPKWLLISSEVNPIFKRTFSKNMQYIKIHGFL
jgi:hypothetical protein